MLKICDFIPSDVSYRERLWHERVIKKAGYNSRTLSTQLKLLQRYKVLFQSVEHK